MSVKEEMMNRNASAFQGGATCGHENFGANVEVERLQDGEGGRVTGFMAGVRVACLDCGAPFGFRCEDVGLQPDRPTMSVDGLELRVPLVSPEGYTPAFPGFRVRKIK